MKNKTELLYVCIPGGSRFNPLFNIRAFGSLLSFLCVHKFITTNVLLFQPLRIYTKKRTLLFSFCSSYVYIPSLNSYYNNKINRLPAHLDILFICYYTIQCTTELILQRINLTSIRLFLRGFFSSSAQSAR